MSISTIRPILLATTLALAGCGGGSGGVLGSISSSPGPTTPATPAAPPPIVPAVTSSQQFAVAGSSHPLDDNQPPQFGADQQLQVRYISSSKSYEVQLPSSSTWGAISYLPIDGSGGGGVPINYGGGGAHLWLGAGYQYSRLFEWSGGSLLHGFEAIGIATPEGAVPVTGTASYIGDILGHTTESFGSDTYDVRGSINLSFDFGLGSLAGTIHPSILSSLGDLNFRDTVFSVGSTTFSGKFDTDLAGVNSFSGLFTGPNAQELIGNFAFPYKSATDGVTYQADGAFVARK